MAGKKGFRMVRAMLVCMLLAAAIPMAARASARTQSEAVSWARTRGNEAWWQDVDGWYGCQCVDLIMAYYDYLEGWHTWGNACDYAGSNELPAGWTRVYSNPRPGDVVVWGAGAQLETYGWADASFGHIGIVIGVNGDGTASTVETNFGKQNAGIYTHYISTAACFIRPAFSGGSSSATPQPQPQPQGSWAVQPAQVEETNAFVYVTYTAPSSVQFQWVGCNFFDENGNEIAKAGEYPNVSGNTVNVYYNITKETHTNYVLSPGTTYKYQFYVTYNGVDHFSPMYTFKTNDHSYVLAAGSKDATCTEDGENVYKCSVCGASYKETIPAKGHSWVLTGKTDATCTADGKETYTCSVCRTVYPVAIPAKGHSWVLTGRTDATCTEDGKETYTCSVCRTVYPVVIPAKGHSWVLTKETNATATQDGVRTYTCYNCFATWNERIPATGSAENPAQPATPSEPQTPAAPQAPAVGAVLNQTGLGQLKVTGKNSVEFVKPAGSPKTVTVPSTVVLDGKSYKVTSIAANAFKGQKKLTKITIGKNVSRIGAKAFSNCAKLKTVVIKTKKLTKSRIGSKAFSGISKKAVFKIVSSKYSAYKKIIKSKGAPKTAKYKVS